MKLLIRNLARTTTEAELRALFEAHGKVQSCTLVIDKKTGGSKGFGFVEMPNDAEAQAAIDSGAAKVIVQDMGKPWIVDKIQLASDHGLSKEFLFSPDVRLGLWLEHLDGDAAIQRRLAGGINDAHAALTELLKQLVRADLCPWPLGELLGGALHHRVADGQTVDGPAGRAGQLIAAKSPDCAASFTSRSTYGLRNI